MVLARAEAEAEAARREDQGWTRAELRRRLENKERKCAVLRSEQMLNASTTLVRGSHGGGLAETARAQVRGAYGGPLAAPEV